VLFKCSRSLWDNKEIVEEGVERKLKKVIKKSKSGSGRGGEKGRKERGQILSHTRNIIHNPQIHNSP
jgi:hypothetical protein